MLNELSKARLRLPQPVQPQDISELTRAAKEQNQNAEQLVTETLSIHMDFTASSTPDPEVSTFV